MTFLPYGQFLPTVTFFSYYILPESQIVEIYPVKCMFLPLQYSTRSNIPGRNITFRAEYWNLHILCNYCEIYCFLRHTIINNYQVTKYIYRNLFFFPALGYQFHQLLLQNVCSTRCCSVWWVFISFISIWFALILPLTAESQESGL